MPLYGMTFLHRTASRKDSLVRIHKPESLRAAVKPWEKNEAVFSPSLSPALLNVLRGLHALHCIALLLKAPNKVRKGPEERAQTRSAF